MKVCIIAALSADGFIARHANHLADWSSKEDKKLFVKLTKAAGVMVMGHTTFKTIGRALPGRRTIVYSRQPGPQAGVEFTSLSPADLLAQLGREGHKEVAICGGRAIYDLFLQAGAVDELYLVVEPLLFGAGVPLAATSLDTRLTLLGTEKLNDNTVLLHYKIRK